MVSYISFQNTDSLSLCHQLSFIVTVWRSLPFTYLWCFPYLVQPSSDFWALIFQLFALVTLCFWSQSSPPNPTVKLLFAIPGTGTVLSLISWHVYTEPLQPLCSVRSPIIGNMGFCFSVCSKFCLISSFVQDFSMSVSLYNLMSRQWTFSTHV